MIEILLYALFVNFMIEENRGHDGCVTVLIVLAIFDYIYQLNRKVESL